MTKDVAQRSPSALLRAVSLSNGSWTFYEAINQVPPSTGKLTEYFKIKKSGVSSIFKENRCP
jgi:hypothetical protein